MLLSLKGRTGGLLTGFIECISSFQSWIQQENGPGLAWAGNHIAYMEQAGHSCIIQACAHVELNSLLESLLILQKKKKISYYLVCTVSCL